jgi:hypothetical protein
MTYGRPIADYPSLVAEWHPTKNGVFSPEEVSYGSAARIWWKCAAGPDHEWVATPNSRTSLGNGCPFCAGRRVSVTNSLAACFPAIAGEWHPSRNEPLTASDIVAGSTRIVWWKCPLGEEHVWASSPHQRTRDLSGCPFCNNLRVSRTNSLGALQPEIAREWHESRNEISAWDVPAGSSRRAWWQCARDPSHEWCVAIASRVLHRSGCPACAGRTLTEARTLATAAPEVAKEWHPAKNEPLLPTNVSVRSNARVWWRCPKGHEWRARVDARTGPRHTGCARCRRGRGRTARRRLAVRTAAPRVT